jgi:hypothetical protein
MFSVDVVDVWLVEPMQLQTVRVGEMRNTYNIFGLLL